MLLGKATGLNWERINITTMIRGTTAIDSDVSMKYKRDIHFFLLNLKLNVYSNQKVCFLSFFIILLTKIMLRSIPWQNLSHLLTVVLDCTIFILECFVMNYFSRSSGQSRHELRFFISRAKVKARYFICS